MKFYYKLSESADRKDAILNGETAKEITLYPETPEIKADYRTNSYSDWWPVSKCGYYSLTEDEFESVNEALNEYYEGEAETIYCIIHDC